MENGERFDERNDNEHVICNTTCECDGPGHCSVYNIHMNKRRYERCKYDCNWRNHYSKYYSKINVDNLINEMRETTMEKNKEAHERNIAIIEQREKFIKSQESKKIKKKDQDKINAQIDEVMKEVEKEGVNLNNYTDKQEGLGDLISNVMSKLGVTEENVQKWSGIGGCGCSARKKFLNKILPFRKKE